MKRLKIFSQGSFLYPLVNAFLVLVLLFVFLPVVIPEARADDAKGFTDNTTPEELFPADSLALASSVKLVNPDESALLLSPRGNISLNFPREAVSEPV